MITSAITGGIATGKSTVSTILKNKHNITIVDADVITREIVEVGKPTLEHLVNAFSTKILNDDGSLNRKYIGDLCFKDKVALNTINRIMGKVIKEESFKQIQKLKSFGHNIVIYDSALLIEMNLQSLYSPIIVVTCSPEIQLQRLMSRNNLTKEDAEARISSQMSLEEKVKYADFVINNDGGLTELNSEIESVVEKLKQL